MMGIYDAIILGKLDFLKLPLVELYAFMAKC